MRRTHGETRGRRSPEYRAWTDMLTRCTNPRARSYYRYGGRGIAVSTRWLKFENFLADMGRKPSAAHSLDREDYNGAYTKSNCRWATPEQQARNKSNIRPLTIDGVTKTLAEWSIVSGTPLKRIWERLAANWTPAAAVFSARRQLRPTHCKNGHVLEQTARFEGCSRRCTACKKAYDAKYRRQAIARGLLPETAAEAVEEGEE